MATQQILKEEANNIKNCDSVVTYYLHFYAHKIELGAILANIIK